MQSYSPNRGFYVVRNRIEMGYARVKIDRNDDWYYAIEIGGVVNRLSVHVGPFSAIRLYMHGDTTKGNKVQLVNVSTHLLRSNKSLIRTSSQNIDGDAIIDINVSDINEYIFLGIFGQSPYTNSDDGTLWIERIDFLK